ncbi:MAG: sulfatase-like hydrolase/transferase [Rikenellaceae bacterium]|nr:sulfatase-like hydrolase/transferase [Rikenellaceae bacterium]
MNRTVLIAAGLAGCIVSPALSAAQERPNVIFIYADDLGKGLLSAYGQKHYTTPNIDSLIARGTSFSRAYGCMLSAPARASLLTGYHDCRPDKWKITPGALLVAAQTECDVAKVEAGLDASDIVLAQGDFYLPEVFKRAGYTTAQIGKLEWGFTATRKQMERHGWDYWLSGPCALPWLLSAFPVRERPDGNYRGEYPRGRRQIHRERNARNLS